MPDFAGLMANRLGRYLKNNPNQVEALGQKALKIASNPAVQQKALNLGKKGFQYAQQNPGMLNRLSGMAGLSAPGSLEQRVGKLEQQMRMLLSMSSQYEGGKRKTRKQKRRGKASKTRKH
jgi:hypothetical protein